MTGLMRTEDIVPILRARLAENPLTKMDAVK